MNLAATTVPTANSRRITIESAASAQHLVDQGLAVELIVPAGIKRGISMATAFTLSWTPKTALQPSLDLWSAGSPRDVLEAAQARPDNLKSEHELRLESALKQLMESQP